MGRGRPGRSASENGMGDPPGVVLWLVLGTETLLVEDAVARIADDALRGGPAAFNRTEGTVGDESVPSMLAQARTAPMLGGRRLVVIREIQKSTVEDLQAFRDYVSAFSPTTVLVLTGTGLPSRGEAAKHSTALRAAFKRKGRVLGFKAGSRNPVEFVVQQVEGGGCAIRTPDARLLVELVGKDLSVLKHEVEKLLAYMGFSGKITATVIEDVCCVLSEAVVWDLTEAIVRRNSGQAMKITHRMLEEGTSPERVLPLITWQIRQLLMLQFCERTGADHREMGVRIFGGKLAAARRTLSTHPLRTDLTMNLLAGAIQDMRGHRAGSRRILEALVLRLVCA